ncbi:hypothetical protein ABFA07_017259 [Porites harrisoni]
MKILVAVIALFVVKQIAAGPAQCYYCLESDSATCSANQRVQTCATDASSLGTTHCGSAAGKYRDRRGNINFGVVRGCINCADKLQACGLIYGALKADRQWTVLQCEIECCTGDKCNTGTVPTLPTPGSVLPTAAGPAQCYYCMENDPTTCTKNQQVQTCATDPSSLGTTHCGSAAGKYRDKDGNINNGFVRGCINCADKREACGIIGGALKVSREWTVLQCEIECCTGDKCNSQLVPTLSSKASSGGTIDTRQQFTGVLAFVALSLIIWRYF